MTNARFNLDNLLRNNSAGSSSSKNKDFPSIGAGGADKILEDTPDRQVRGSMSSKQQQPQQQAPMPQQQQQQQQVPRMQAPMPQPAPPTIDRNELINKIRSARMKTQLVKRIHEQGVSIPQNVSALNDQQLQSTYDEINAALCSSDNGGMIKTGLMFIPPAWEKAFNLIKPNGMTLNGFAKRCAMDPEFAYLCELLAWKYGKSSEFGPEIQMLMFMVKMSITCATPAGGAAIDNAQHQQQQPTSQFAQQSQSQSQSSKAGVTLDQFADL